MNPPGVRRTLSRREFVQLGGLAVAATLAHPVLARTPTARRVLVLLHLEGGNDAFHTIFGPRDAGAARLRPTLTLRAADLLPLADGVALHPACEGMRDLFSAGALALLPRVTAGAAPGAGHFAAEEAWETAGGAAGRSTGWIGAALGGTNGDIATGPIACHAGAAPPQAFAGLAPGQIASLTDAARALGRPVPPAVSRLETELRTVAHLVAAGFPARVYRVRAAGFDTHGGQRERQALALGTWSAALARFHRELRERGVGRDVVALSYSEFGREVRENAAGGTDHGGAGLVCLSGAVEGGIAGEIAPLVAADEFPPIHAAALHALVAEHWLHGGTARLPLHGWTKADCRMPALSGA